MTNEELDALVARLRSDTPNMVAWHKAMHDGADAITARVEGGRMSWLQKMAWEEAFKLLSRSPSQLKKMGFNSIGDAAVFEYKRVAALGRVEGGDA